MMKDAEILARRIGGFATVGFGMLLILAGFVLLVKGTNDADVASRGGVLVLSFVWVKFVVIPVGIGFMAWGIAALRSLGHAKATEKKRMAEAVRVYKEPDSRSPMITELAADSTLEGIQTLRKVKDNLGLEWVMIRLRDGQVGYVIEGLPTYTTLNAIIASSAAPVYGVPNRWSEPLATLSFGATLEINKTEWDSTVVREADADAIHWVNAWLPSGEHGYISGKTKVVLKAYCVGMSPGAKPSCERRRRWYLILRPRSSGLYPANPRSW